LLLVTGAVMVAVLRRAEFVRQQSDGLDELDVFFGPVCGQQSQPDECRAPVRTVPDQPAPGVLNLFRVASQRGCGDVLVVVNRNVDIMKCTCQFCWLRPGSREVDIQDGGCFNAVATAIFRGPAPPVLLVVGIRLSVTRQRNLRVQTMQPQRVVIEAYRTSGRFKPGLLAHRRARDSILSVMRPIMPAP
jgi:hypothetical protein